MGQRLDITNLPSGMVLMEKYRVVKTLGIGGMGIVIACDHLELGSRVAIKFMLTELVSNQKVVKRFMIEARASTRIQSEHVARVIDVGRWKNEGLPEEGVPFLVMEYLQGRDLSEWVRMGKKFPIDEAIDYIVQAAEALAQAHRVGVIHRDIKPANLFLAEREDAMIGTAAGSRVRKMIKVLDFGISKLLDEEPQEMGLTKTTTVLGSGLYMSPEQMRSAKNVDFRTDIYSLGVCLYELLTGTQPYTAETFSELCVKVNIDPPTPIRDYRPDVSLDFAAAIARAYAKDPDQRYQTVQDLVAGLLPYAAAPSRPTIQQIQGITRHHSIPPPPPAALSGQHTAVAAVTEVPEARQRSSGSGGIVVAFVAVAILAGGVGLLFVKRPAVIFGTDTPSSTVEAPAAPPHPPEPTATTSTTTATSSAPTNVIDLDDSDEPPPTHPTASVKSTGGKTPPPPPPEKKPPPPVKMCNCMGADGLMGVRPCPCP